MPLPSKSIHENPVRIELPTIALAACCLASACTTTDVAPAQGREERQFRTGSNIPLRDPSTPVATKTIDREHWERDHGTPSISGRQER